MADRLTQLQDCYDQLATQFYASIRYISLHHNTSPFTTPLAPTSNSTTTPQPPPPLSNQPNHSPTTETNNQQQQQQQQQHPQPINDPPSERDPTLLLPPEQRPDDPSTLLSAQRELAHDLILKTKQIEYIIGVLPGVENSKERQEERIRELEGELRGALAEREGVERERRTCVGRVEGVIGAVQR